MKTFPKILTIFIVFLTGLMIGLDLGCKLAITSQKIELDKNNETNLTLPESENTVDLIIDFGEADDKQEYNNVEIAEGGTVLDLLKKITEENNLEFDYKDYGGGLGAFIESINNVKNDSSKNLWWQYWINDKYAILGASNYEMKDGDIIEWKYIEGQISN